MRAIRVLAASAVVAVSVGGLTSCGSSGGGGLGGNNATLVHLLTTTTPSATTGVFYSLTFDATFPNPPGLFILTGGALPPGLKLDKFTGVLSGYPRQVGNFTFEVAARDGRDPALLPPNLPVDRDQTFSEDRRLFHMQVGLGIPNLLPQVVPTAQYRASYSYFLDVAGGTPPYTFALTSGPGSLPTGLNVSPLTGEIGSFPSAVNPAPGNPPFQFSVTVTDAHGLQDTEPLSVQVVVLPLFILTSNPIQGGAIAFPYDLTFELASTGGGSPYTWEQVFPLIGGETDLATIGLQVTTGGHLKDTGAGPTLVGTYNFRVRVTDEALQTDTRAYSITINPGPVLLTINPNRSSSPPPYTFTGLNFQPGAKLYFKPGPTETTVTPTFVNATTLVVSGAIPRPVNGAGGVDVKVVNPDGGSSTKPNGFVFPANTIAFATKGFFASPLSSSSIAVGDLNGDGRADIVHAGSSGQQAYSGGPSSNGAGLRLHMNLGTNPPTFGTTSLDSISFTCVRIADLNNDGRPDIIGVTGGGTYQIRTWINNPLGTFTPGPTTSLSSMSSFWPGQFALGKLNSDGILDLALGMPHQPWLGGGSYSQGRLDTYMGLGTGGFTFSQAATTTILANSYGPYGVASVVLHDTDGNGRDEIAAGSNMGIYYYANAAYYNAVDSNGAFQTWGGLGPFNAGTVYYAGAHNMALADFSGNNQKQIVWIKDGAPNYSNARNIGFLSGTNFSTYVELTAPAIVMKSVTALDADFDQKIDWAITSGAINFGQASGQIAVYKGATQATVLTLDANTGTPTVSSPNVGWVASGDLDGDGRPDIVATTSFWQVEGMAANHGNTYTLGVNANGGSQGIVFYLNSSN